MNYANVVAINSVTSSSSITSSPIELDNMLYLDAIAVVTGTCTGSIKIQKSNSTDAQVHLGTDTWFDITSSSQNFTNATNLNWSYADIGYRLVRVVVTVGSGTAVVTLQVNVKGFI